MPKEMSTISSVKMSVQPSVKPSIFKHLHPSTRPYLHPENAHLLTAHNRSQCKFQVLTGKIDDKVGRKTILTAKSLSTYLSLQHSMSLCWRRYSSTLYANENRQVVEPGKWLVSFYHIPFWCKTVLLCDVVAGLHGGSDRPGSTVAWPILLTTKVFFSNLVLHLPKDAHVCVGERDDHSCWS